MQIRAADADAASRYGDLFAGLRSVGSPIPTNDIWIAAVTLVTGAHLLTFRSRLHQDLRAAAHRLA